MMSNRSKKEDKEKKNVEQDDLAVSLDDVMPNAEQSKGALSVEPELLQENLDVRLLRLQADFENFRKRVVRERAELFKRANEDLIFELLAVLDNMERALSAADEHGVSKAFSDGFKAVMEQMLSVLGKFGVEQIQTAGKTFDPAEHEAVAHLPSAEVPDGGLIEETRRGYRLAGRLLRAAQVVVSSGKSGSGQKTAPDIE